MREGTVGYHSSTTQITELLAAWQAGDEAAAEPAITAVYSQLCRLARRQLATERPNHTLEPAELVHEAFLRLKSRRKPWRNRAHFLALAAGVMRRLLIDTGKSRSRLKRRVPQPDVLSQELGRERQQPIGRASLVDLKRALRRLATVDPLKARIVELRYFGGMTSAEISVVCDCSIPTVTRHWRMSKAWLLRELRQGGVRS